MEIFIRMDFLEYKQLLFSKFHSSIRNICWIITPLVLVVELMVFIIFRISGLLVPPFGSYILLRIVFPSVVDFSVLICYTIAIAYDKFSGTLKNWLSCIQVWILCSVVSIIHNYFSMLLMLPCIPVLVSSLYGDKKLTRGISLASFLSTLISFYTWVQTYNDRLKLIVLVTNIVVTLMILLCCYLFALFIMRTQIDQTDFVLSAYSQQKDLIQEMHIDSLTKMYNRAALEESINLYIRKFYEGECIPHLVLIDVDHFKNINDTYGHNNGDIVLKSLADIIHDEMKGINRSFRFGGDEMVLLFDVETNSQISNIISAIQADFAGVKFPFNPSEKFTVSMGVAPFYKGLDAKGWFELADSAMYTSKEGGRNRITFAEDF